MLGDKKRQARLIIHQLRMTKSSAMFRFCAKDDPKLLAAVNANDRTIDEIISYWEGKIAQGGTALESALKSYHAQLRRSEEDDVIARADEIKANRIAEELNDARG